MEKAEVELMWQRVRAELEADGRKLGGDPSSISELRWGDVEGGYKLGLIDGWNAAVDKAQSNAAAILGSLREELR